MRLNRADLSGILQNARKEMRWRNWPSAWRSKRGSEENVLAKSVHGSVVDRDRNAFGIS